MLRIDTEWQGGMTGPGLSTLYFEGTTQSEADAAVDTVADWWTDMGPAISSACSWSIGPEVSVVDAASGQTTGVFAVTARSGTGGNGTDQIAQASQGLLRLRTGFFVAGREIRGHLFIPGPTESHNAAGAPVAGYISDVNSRANTNLILGAGALQVYSRKNGVAHNVATATCWNKWASLRSRRD